jgi:hypothetical protein
LSLLGASYLWKVQVSGWVCFFGWLVLHGRCWTSNHLRRHGLSDTDDCALCAQEVETLDHLLTGCVTAGKLVPRALLLWSQFALTHGVVSSGSLAAPSREGGS